MSAASARALDAATRDHLARIVAAITPNWMTDRDDLVQMAAVKLLRGSIDPPWGDPLLRRVAYSVVVDELRRRRRRAEVGMSPSMPDRIANSGDITPELRAQGAELGRVLLECLQAVAPDRRRAVTLYLQDHTVPEIASLLDWDAKRASNAVYRGLADLRDRLSARGLGF